MSKKGRWENEEANFANPFAALKKPSEGGASACDGPEPVPAPKATKLPRAKSARIERAHHGGKTVTVVQFHGEPDEGALTTWLKQARTSLGVGGSLEDDHVILQGEQIERLNAAKLL